MEQHKKTALAKIYMFRPASKGHASLYFYFLTDKKDTVKSDVDIYAKYSKQYYLTGRFLINYSSEDHRNYELLLDRSY